MLSVFLPCWITRTRSSLHIPHTAPGTVQAHSGCSDTTMDWLRPGTSRCQEHWAGSVGLAVFWVGHQKPLVLLLHKQHHYCLNLQIPEVTSAPFQQGHSVYDGTFLRTLLLPPCHPAQFQAPSRKMLGAHLLKDRSLSCHQGMSFLTSRRPSLQQYQIRSICSETSSLCRTPRHRHNVPVTPQDDSVTGFFQACHQAQPLFINSSLSRV